MTESSNSLMALDESVATYDFDLFFDAGLLHDPHARVKKLIEEAPPVFWTPRNGGHWVATHYEDIFKVLHEPERFSSVPYSPERWARIIAAMPPGAPRMPNIVPVLTDPPAHTRFRAPLQRAFSPRAIMRLKDEIEALTHRLIDEVLDRGECEFIAAVAMQLPVQTFLKLVGLPPERIDVFRKLVREILGPGSDPRELARRVRHVADAMLDVILARRTEPRDDLISRLWETQVDGQPMTLELIEDYAVNLFLGGMDTVTNAIGFGMRHLATNPDFQNELRSNPSLIPDAVEELLRRYSFVTLRRRITRDTELRGQRLKAEDTIYLCLPAAALDSSVFTEPETFDLTRSNKSHMAFGSGPHTCVGAHLARLELQTLFSVVLQRLPPFRLDERSPVKFHAGTIFAFASLPLRWK